MGPLGTLRSIDVESLALLTNALSFSGASLYHLRPSAKDGTASDGVTAVASVIVITLNAVLAVAIVVIISGEVLQATGAKSTAALLWLHTRLSAGATASAEPADSAKVAASVEEEELLALELRRDEVRAEITASAEAHKQRAAEEHERLKGKLESCEGELKTLRRRRAAASTALETASVDGQATVNADGLMSRSRAGTQTRVEVNPVFEGLGVKG